MCLTKGPDGIEAEIEAEEHEPDGNRTQQLVVESSAIGISHGDLEIYCSQLEEFAEALGLLAADWNLSLFLVVRFEHVAGPEPRNDFRQDLFAELRKLIKPTISQAKSGKLALLRILTRYTRYDSPQLDTRLWSK